MRAVRTHLVGAWHRSVRAWTWARQHPTLATFGGLVAGGVPLLGWETGEPGIRVGEVADIVAAAAVAASWPRTEAAPVIAIGAGVAGVAGWAFAWGQPVEQGGAQLAAALGVGTALWAIHRPRRPKVVVEAPSDGPDVAGEVRRAMVDAGLVHRPGAGLPPEVPRLVGGGVPDRDAAVIRLSWVLPPRVKVAQARSAEETLSHRLGARLGGAEVRILVGEHSEVVTEIRRGQLASLVRFDEFYRRHPAPAGGLVVGVGVGRCGPAWLDFGVTPHALVAGTPQSGKSAAVRQMLTRLALDHGPVEVRLALVDVAKRGVEFITFARTPHALGLAKTAPEALDLLAMVDAELDRRWDELTRAVDAGRIAEPDIAAWLAAGGEPWPRIVVAVDELAELTAGCVDKRLREAATEKLGKVARVGRAAGGHLLVATQRPDADAIPGQFRACVDGALCFRVANAVNSRVVLDCDRAAYLPEVKGRALWQVGAALEQVQTPFLTAQEARALLERRWERRPVVPVPSRSASASPETFDAFADAAEVDDDLAGNVVRLR